MYHYVSIAGETNRFIDLKLKR